MLLLDEKRLVVAVWERLRSHFGSSRRKMVESQSAVWERLRSHFGSSRRKMVESQSNCANLKKAHFLSTCYGSVFIVYCERRKNRLCSAIGREGR